MGEHDDEVQEDPNDPGHARLPVDALRALRKAARERNDLEAQLNANSRELAFAKADLDHADPRLKYFIKGYEGDLTPEAIRTQAEADGFLKKMQQDPTPPPGANPREVQAQQRLARASSGANDTPAPELGDLIRQAKNPEEIMKLMVQAGYPTTWNRQDDY